jgi:iron complex outermembrane receptor protein
MRNLLLIRRLWATSASAFALSMAVPCVAQEGESDRVEDGARLGEIVVTATKRAENVQSIPLAVSAIGADTLERENIDTIDDIRNRVPSLQSYSFNVGVPTYTIRGIGSIGRSLAVDGAVGLFMNEVYLGRGFLLNTDLADIERVEVLRGPQGTTFGRNTIGGALSFHTSKPSDSVRMKGQLSIGNYDAVDMKAFISGPLSEKLAAKLAVVSRNRDGFNFNTTTNNDVEDLNFLAVSGSLLYKPTENLELLLNFDTSRRRGTGDWWVIQNEGPLAGRAYANPRRGDGHTDDGLGNVNNKGADLHLSYEIDAGTVTSITAYREGDMHSSTNSTGKRVALLTDPPAVKAVLGDNLFVQDESYDARQFSQELRFASNKDGPVNWIAGLFYFKENVDHLRFTHARSTARNTETRGGFDSTGWTESYAGFASVGVAPTRWLELQGGLRWTHERKFLSETAFGQSSGRPYTIEGVPAPSGFTSNARSSWEALTPSLSVNLKPSSTKFLYATVSRGFRSGGFNDNQTEKVDAETPFDPEYVWNYEIGAKTEWFDRRLRLNVAGFFLDYSNQQVGIAVPNTSPVIFVTGNAGKSTVKGFEIEAEATPIPGLYLNAAYTYLKSRLDDLPLTNGGNLRGNEMPRVPRNKLYLSASYEFDIGEFDLIPRLSYNYTDRQFTTTANNLPEVVPPTENIDWSVGIENKDRGYGVEFWMKNAQNNLNYTALFSFSGTVYGHMSPPRTYGVTLTIKN